MQTGCIISKQIKSNRKISHQLSTKTWSLGKSKAAQ
jgi:hypothetical protein